MTKSWHEFLKFLCYVASTVCHQHTLIDQIAHKVLSFGHSPCHPPAPGGLLQRCGLKSLSDNSFKCGEEPANIAMSSTQLAMQQPLVISQG
jgi:hypothetical protein